MNFSGIWHTYSKSYFELKRFPHVYMQYYPPEWMLFASKRFFLFSFDFEWECDRIFAPIHRPHNNDTQHDLRNEYYVYIQLVFFSLPFDSHIDTLLWLNKDHLDRLHMKKLEYQQYNIQVRNENEK